MEISLKLIIYQVINFVVLMAVLGFLFNKFIRPMMHKRAEEIKKSFEDIEKQKKEIEVLKQNYADQIKGVHETAKIEIEKAMAEGNRMRGDIVAQAGKESNALIERAKKEIEHEKQKAVMEIQKEVATLSLLATKQLIKKQMDASTNRQLVEEFLDELNNNPPEKN
jgi:F-type H+-transporting ATPase subunit b